MSLTDPGMLLGASGNGTMLGRASENLSRILQLDELVRPLTCSLIIRAFFRRELGHHGLVVRVRRSHLRDLAGDGCVGSACVTLSIPGCVALIDSDTAGFGERFIGGREEPRVASGPQATTKSATQLSAGPSVLPAH